MLEWGRFCVCRVSPVRGSAVRGPVADSTGAGAAADDQYPIAEPEYGEYGATLRHQA